MKKISKNILCLLASLLLTGNVMAQNIDLDAWIVATPESPYDVTSLLQNPTCMENFGWSRNSADAAAGYNKHNTEFASSVYNNTGIESWYWSPVKNADLIWQDVKGLLGGTYRITAYVVAQIYNNSSTKGQCGKGTHFFAGEAQINITSNKWEELTVTTTIGKDETLRIGIKGDEFNENDWVSIAGIKIECIGYSEMSSYTAIALDESFDVSIARQFHIADVTLIRTLSKKDYTPIYLPFNLNKEQCSEYFNEILLVTNAQTVNTKNITLITSTCEEIHANTPYLVKGKKDGKTKIKANPVVINPVKTNTTTLPNGMSLTGTYRSTEGLDDTYQHSNGTNMTLHKSPAHIKGYSFFISPKQ